MAPLLTFYREGRRKGTFETGVQLALRRLLASPTFVFRVEEDPTTIAAGAVYRVSDVELASRLSFFLWSSMPDDALLDLAASNRLHVPAVLEAQVRRMLADPKADALVENFAGQWLQIRNLQNIAPNTDEFPDFDNDLRDAFRRETELFFRSVVREDRNVLDLMTADYTFVNERLAKHYGTAWRVRQPVPPRDARRRGAARAARQGQHPAGDVARRPHRRRRCAASGSSRICSARRRRRRPPTCRRSSRPRGRSHARSGSGWRSTARTRRARAATGRWTRSGSRSRTSTPSARGARATPATTSTPRARWPTARRWSAWQGFARRCSSVLRYSSRR